MIELPADAVPAAAMPSLVDFGFMQTPSTGAAASRINRPGSRWKVDFTLPPVTADRARVLISRLAEGKSQGLRVPFPLQVSQGAPGVPTVDGSGAAGTSLPVKGLNAHYTIKEGYWLTLIDGDGVHYLHTNRSAVAADASGEATLTIWPPLRAPMADDDLVLLAKPLVEGLISSEVSWTMTPDRLVALAFTIEEAA